jgi:hypothetical protein
MFYRLTETLMVDGVLQVQGVEEEALWKEMKAAGLNTWSSINTAYPSDDAGNVEAIKKVRLTVIQTTLCAVNP